MAYPAPLSWTLYADDKQVVPLTLIMPPTILCIISAMLHNKLMGLESCGDVKVLHMQRATNLAPVLIMQPLGLTL
jgi:hypothetical protein